MQKKGAGYCDSFCNEVYFYMAHNALIGRELQAVEMLKNEVSRRYGLLDLRVFGSKARGDFSSDSDIDVMLELDEFTPEIESAIDDIVFDINLDHDCFITTVIFSRKELDEGPMGESPLYKAIEREGIKI